MKELSILAEAREIVRNNPMSLQIAHLKQCADELHNAYVILCGALTREAVMQFIAHVNRCVMAIELVVAPVSPGGSGGALPVPKTNVETKHSA